MADDTDLWPFGPLSEGATIQRLDLQPGETLVLTVNRSLSMSEAASLKACWSEAMRDTRLLVLDSGMTLSVVSEAS